MKIYDSAHQLQLGSYDKAIASKFNFNYDSQPQKYIKLTVDDAGKSIMGDSVKIV